jgi:hypothetical protein
MATVKADLRTNATAVPPVRSKVNRLGGRVRWFEATYTQPALGNIGDVIEWGDLPLGARTIGHLSQLNFAAGTASSTLTVGDAASANRHLAATSVAAAGVAVPQAANASGAQFETSDASETATNNTRLTSTVAGAGLAAGQVLTLKVAYVCD